MKTKIEGVFSLPSEQIPHEPKLAHFVKNNLPAMEDRPRKPGIPIVLAVEKIGLWTGVPGQHPRSSILAEPKQYTLLESLHLLTVHDNNVVSSSGAKLVAPTIVGRIHI